MFLPLPPDNVSVHSIIPPLSPSSADWMLGDVPDTIPFTPLAPIDTSLPAYDEADLSVGCSRKMV